MLPVIQAENISKAYQIGEFSTGTLSQDIERWWSRVRGKEDRFLKIGETNDRTSKGESNMVWSLKDISFNIGQGEAVGIIGRNGAGKSTLLKILSRVTTPTRGSIKLKGRIASLLEVGTGFHPELSGRENVYLNGAILGMRKHEIKSKFDEIVDFAGVERYIDTPVKRYSSGMYVRLAFAVAAYLESEILIVDEVLAVGDTEFQKKCLGKMGQVSTKDGKTVLFVSHSMGAVQQLCEKALILEHGMLKNFGKTQDVINEYLSSRQDVRSFYKGPEQSEKKIWFKSISVTNLANENADEYLHDERIVVNFNLEYNIDRQGHDYTLFCMVLDSVKNRIFASESSILTSDQVKMVIDSDFLVRGNYSLHAFIHKGRVEQIDAVEDVCTFSVIDNGSAFTIHGDYDYGKVFAKVDWEYV
jgi:lipopolysaccharide transport system ATP-binding protein